MSPSVCAVMLTADRHELAAKAVACFLRQTYDNKALLIYDTGVPLPIELDQSKVAHAIAPERRLPIGALRNNAARLVNADVIVHWDDDDWSHPERISEQVELLQASGAEAVGYNEMLFWRDSEAWLWTNATRNDRPCGTSLCYWRKTWAGAPFHDELPSGPDSTSEYHHWTQSLRLIAESSIPRSRGMVSIGESIPRMVARIHGGNSSGQYKSIGNQASTSWRRVPDWDEHVRFILEGA
jgi:Glycosyl transferase family 2